MICREVRLWFTSLALSDAGQRRERVALIWESWALALGVPGVHGCGVDHLSEGQCARAKQQYLVSLRILYISLMR